VNSAIYTGRLRHRRFSPRENTFEYRLFMMYIDLAELDEVFAGSWLWSARRPALAWLRRADYLGDPSIPLDQAVRELVVRETGRRPEGPIRMLTHLRYFGYGFNPVTFYYCFDAAGREVETIVAEITNTPWNERHAYVLDSERNEGRGGLRRHRFRKTFHVSPFMPMEVGYDWRFSAPGERLFVHMENYQEGIKTFDATLTLERGAVTAANLNGALASFPLMTLKVIGAIYWQALKLWVKRVPFHPHPAKLPRGGPDSTRPASMR
jgi:hypothetical protein